jgi:hypothetical protein
MNPPAAPTIRSEEERNAVHHLRQALLWRVKVQLSAMPSITSEQFNQMVQIAVWDTQALAGEITQLFGAIDALQKVGWRPADAFDRALPPPAGAQAAQPQPGQGQGGSGNQELDAFGRDLKKGFQEMGGTIDGWLGGKKK